MATDYVSVADFEAASQTKLKTNVAGTLTWACACGSKRFIVLSQKNNVKLVCAKCKHIDIIAWYHSARDSSAGHILNLNTQQWEK